MRRAVVLVLILLLAAAASAQDEAGILARLESEDAAVREAAENAWDQLDEAQQVRLARAALTDPVAPGALAAARRLSPWSLDLDEMSRQAQALLSAPDIRLHSLPACIGAPDVATVWRVAGDRTAWFEDLHRVTGVDSLPALLDQAGNAPPAQWIARVWNIRIVAWHSDAYRDRVAEFVAEDLLRVPDVELPRPVRDDSGLPPHFETVARCAWGLEPRPSRGSTLSGPVPWAWMIRWMSEVAPTASDVPFLDDVVRRAHEDAEARAWALRHRVRLSGDGAATWLRSLLGDDEGPDCEPELAAHLALLGHRDARDALLARDPDAAAKTPLLWRVDRDAAIAAAADGAFDLSVQGRARMRLVWGIDVGDDDLADVAARRAAYVDAAVRLDEYPWELARLVDLYARDFPEGVRGPAARGLAERLARLGPDADALGFVARVVVLGLLEVRARDELVDVLRAWCGDGPELQAIAVSALLTIAEPVDAELAWASWTGHRSWWDERTAIGLHPDAVVAKRLRAVAESGEDGAGDAVEALARRAGLAPQDVRDLGIAVEEDRDVLAAVLAALDAGRPREALRIAGEEQFVRSLSPDAMRAVRDRRENELYWEATLGLALTGDAEATGEIERLLRENRTPILDTILLAADPRIGRRFARLHAERLAHNCCARFESATALRNAFPTMPVADEWTLATQREIAIAWLDAHEDDLAFSKIANGWLPR